MRESLDAGGDGRKENLIRRAMSDEVLLTSKGRGNNMLQMSSGFRLLRGEERSILSGEGEILLVGLGGSASQAGGEDERTVTRMIGTWLQVGSPTPILDMTP